MRKLSKKTLSVILAVLIVLCAAPMGMFYFGVDAFAATSGVYTYSITDDEATITDVDKSIGGTVTVPSALSSYPVVGIGDNAFTGSDVESVIIPESVKSIGSHAFSQCDSLTSVSIGINVTEIDVSAFEDCNSLETVVIPAAVNAIGESAFSRCDSLKSIFVSESNANYSSVDGVLFDKQQTALIQYPIGNIVPQYTVPATVTAIGNAAFYECENISTVNLPAGLTSIGSEAFYYCNNLKGITLPESVTSIGDCAFSWCDKISQLMLPSGIKQIGEEVFSGCASLTAVEITSVEAPLGNYMFSDCALLEKVIMPSGMTEIGEGTFTNCYSLTEVKLPESVTAIGDYAFDGCSGIVSVEFPLLLNSIGEYAFQNCSLLENIIIPDKATSIGEGAFYGCNEITQVTIPQGVTSIGAKAFGYYEDNGDIKVDNFKITGEIESAAHKYAKDNAIAFIPLTGCTHEDVKHVKIDSNCLKTGEEYDLCNICDEKLNYQVIAISGHTDENADLICDVCKKSLVEQKTVTGLKVTSASTSIKLTWTAIPGSTGYLIYKYNPSTKKYETYKKVTANSISVTGLEANTTLYFRVRAYKVISNATHWGITSAAVKACSAPAKVMGVKTSAYSTAALKLIWNKVPGATGYRVYKYNNASKKYEFCKNTTQNTAFVSGLNAGSSYYFLVRAYRIVGSVTYWGDASSYLKTATRPLNVQISSVVSAAKAKLTAKTARSAGATGYIIEYSTNSKFTSGVTRKYTTSLSTTYSGLTSGRYYFVRVRPYVLAGNVKVYSPSYSSVKYAKVK